VPQSREQISMSFAPVVRNTAPSVVNVYAKRIVQSQGRALWCRPVFPPFLR
jgi:S1-C subfamily serine protease